MMGQQILPENPQQAVDLPDGHGAVERTLGVSDLLDLVSNGRWSQEQGVCRLVLDSAPSIAHSSTSNSARAQQQQQPPPNTTAPTLSAEVQLSQLISKWVRYSEDATSPEDCLQLADYAEGTGASAGLLPPFTVVGAVAQTFRRVLRRHYPRERFPDTNPKRFGNGNRITYYPHLVMLTDDEVEESVSDGAGASAGGGGGGANGTGGFVRVERAEEGDSYRLGKSLMCVVCFCFQLKVMLIVLLVADYYMPITKAPLHCRALCCMYICVCVCV